MKTNNLLIIAVITVLLAACGAGSKKSNDMEKRTQVKIETTMGDIVVELYNETPNTATTSSSSPRKVCTTLPFSTASFASS